MASRRVALVLMGLFLACLILQTLLPQQGTLPPLQYARWQARYPALAQGAKTLGLDRISSTRWFWALGFALAGSLALSTGRRALAMMRNGPSPRGPQMTLGVVPSGESLQKVTAVLRRHGYGISDAREGILGRKGAPGPWGSLLFHGGLVLLFLGVLVSVSSRFKGFVELAPGQLFEERQGYLAQRSGALARPLGDLAVAVLDMGVAFWPDGTVKDIWAEVAAQEGSGEMKEGVVRRNHALKLGPSSVTFVSPFGPAAHLRYTPPGGEQAEEGYLHFAVGDPPLRNTLVIPGTATEVEAELEGPWQGVLEGRASTSVLTLHLATQDKDGKFVRSALRPGETAALGGGELQFVALEPWALFMVSRDRGLPIMIASGLIALAGLALALFVVPRWMWVLPAQEGWQVMGQTPWAEASFQAEIRGIGVEIGGSKQWSK